jgi:inner membrane protein
LIGVALIIYYTLLLSLSEQVGYNMAYAISSIATILLVSVYATSFLKRKPIVLLFTTLMSGFYVFIYVIIQAEDYSLLIGSVGLFLIIGFLMYFSRNIKWYNDQKSLGNGLITFTPKLLLQKSRQYLLKAEWNGKSS